MRTLFAKQNRKQLVILLVSFAILISGFSYFLVGKQGIGEVIIAAFISFPIYAFVIGSIVAIFRFKGLKYLARWIAASLVTLFVIDSIFLLGCLVLIVKMTMQKI